jgi:hypothetical protein
MSFARALRTWSSSGARLGLALGLASTLAAGCGSGGGGGAPAPSSAGAGATGGSSGPTLAPVKYKPSTTYVIDREGEGFLERNDGKLLCHVKGTPREMGEQYGALLGEKIERLVRELPAFLRTQSFPAWLLPSMTTTTVASFEALGSYPSDVKEFASGVVAGNRRRRPSSFLTRDDILFLSSLVDLGGITNGIVTCSTVAVWGPIAQDGKMFQTRCVDLFVGSGIEENAVVVIEKRDGKVPWANAGWAGMVGAASGMNAHGVAIGQVWAFSNDKWFGEPWPMTMRRAMESSVSADDAVATLRAVNPRTYGSNFVFGDKGDARGGEPKAYAVESSANYLAVFEDNDPKEDLAVWNGPNGPEPYAIKIPFACFRGDVTMDPGMRSRSTSAGGPHGDPRGANSYLRRYKGQADRVLAYVNAGQPIGARELIDLTKGVATPRGSLQCVVYANSDLELWVADSRMIGPFGSMQAVDAFNEPYTHFDFNYYLPTIEASLDRAVYSAGSTQTVFLDTSNLGDDRDLWVWITLEGPGGTATHAEGGAPLPLSFPRGISLQAPFTLTLPAGLPAGDYRLVATLAERGTSDVVDISIAAFRVQ